MSTLIHAALGYLFLVLVVRILARRPGSQMTPFEAVIIFLIGGVIILATVGKDRSVTNCSTAILMVASMHCLVSTLKSRFPTFGALVDGTPLVLLQNGHWCEEAMKHTRIDPEDVMAAGRTKGVQSIFDIEYAILECNGGISIIKANASDQS
jgi:uncharacterized membrane protein YcaP (DUF421 family)